MFVWSANEWSSHALDSNTVLKSSQTKADYHLTNLKAFKVL